MAGRPVPGALKLWMGAVRMGGVLWVVVLKRDPHAPGDRSERDSPLFRAGSFTMDFIDFQGFARS
jgi:hypothetical protein